MSQTTEDLFVDEVLPPEAPPEVLDRSTLERWALCPHEGWHVGHATVSTSSTAADVGNAAHDILAAAVKLRATEGASAFDLRDFIQTGAINSRPDIQPAVLDALRRAYPITDLITRRDNGEERAPEDLLRYDGGEGDAAGQLAGDLMPAAEDGSRGPIRLTMEVDLLMATASVEELDVIDWKSGFTHWTASDVEDSFQFQFYAWVIFRCYPSVNRVRVRVFMTREGTATSPVEFTREKLFPFGKRLMNAVALYLEHHAAEDPAKVPAWAAPEKCSICPAAVRCIHAHSPAADLARDPEGYLRQYIAIDAAASQMKAAMSAAVRKSGSDFVFGDVGFGANKPSGAPRAKACDAYDLTPMEKEGSKS